MSRRRRTSARFLCPSSGEIEAHEVGQRETKGGALWGTAIGSGVASVPGLARRNADNLAVSLAETNEVHYVVDELPGESDVAKWIVQAKELPGVVVY